MYMSNQAKVALIKSGVPICRGCWETDGVSDEHPDMWCSRACADPYYEDQAQAEADYGLEYVQDMRDRDEHHSDTWERKNAILFV